MKIKLYLFAATLGLCFQANAQVEKGMVLIGSSTNLLGNLNSFGGAGFSNNAGIQFGKEKNKIEGTGLFDGESEINITSFNASPTAGYFVSDHILLGASVGFWIYRTKDEDDEKFGINTISFSPFVRGYFKHEGSSLPFVEVKGGLMNVKYTEGDDPSDNFTFFTFKVGNSFFIGQRTSLDLFADYNYAKTENDLEGVNGTITNTSGYFGVGVGLSVFLDGKSGGSD